MTRGAAAAARPSTHDAIHRGEAVIRAGGIRDGLPRTLFFGVVFGAAYHLFRLQRFGPATLGELQHHLEFARELSFDPLRIPVPHPGFHLMALALEAVTGMSLANAGVLLLAAFVVGIAAMQLIVLSTFLGRASSGRLALGLASATMVASAIWLPPFNRNFYLGQGTPNLWAVPTLVVLKPFALAAVLLFVPLARDRDRERTSARRILLSIVLAVGLVMKPSFALCFFPAALLFLLARRPRDVRAILASIAVWIPAALVLLLQFRLWRGEWGSGVALTFFGVWRGYTPNVAVSVLLATAFPLSLLLARFRSVARNDHLVLSWLITLAGFLQFAFLAETRYFDFGNFSWGWNVALWLLFLFSTVELGAWLAGGRPAHRGERVAARAVCMVFALHVASGVAYLVKQMLGLGYF